MRVSQQALESSASSPSRDLSLRQPAPLRQSRAAGRTGEQRDLLGGARGWGVPHTRGDDACGRDGGGARVRLRGCVLGEARVKQSSLSTSPCAKRFGVFGIGCGFLKSEFSQSSRERERGRSWCREECTGTERDVHSGPGGYEMCFISVLRVTVLTTEYCTCHLQGADVNHSRRARAAITSSTLPAPPAASPPPSHSRLCRPRCRSAS